MSPFDTIAAAGRATQLAIRGQSVAYEQPPADAFAISVIWTERTGQPTTAWCRLSDFPLLESGERMKPRKGDRITSGSRTYRVGDPAFDETDGSVLLDLRLMGVS